MSTTCPTTTSACCSPTWPPTSSPRPTPNASWRPQCARRIEAEPRRRPRDLSLRRTRVAIAGIGLVVATSAVLALSPASREAVAGWLGIRGVHIERRVAPPAELGTELSLGDRVGLAAARRRVAFDVLLPPRGPYGPPEEVYVARAPTGGRVSLLYRSAPDLPPATRNGVGLLITEFRAEVDEGFINKIVVNGGRLEAVTVDGEPGYWFEGEDHVVGFADENGTFFDDDSRLAGNTLIWERGPLTLRLESALSKDEAIRLARSLTG